MCVCMRGMDVVLQLLFTQLNSYKPLKDGLVFKMHFKSIAFFTRDVGEL